MAPLHRTSHDTRSLTLDTTMKATSIQNGERDMQAINAATVSQNSSFTTNTGSALVPSSSSNSQTTFADISSTPPTSSEDPSSQSQASQLSQPIEPESSEGHKQTLRPMPRQSDLMKGGDTAKVGRIRKTPPRTVPALQLGIAGQKRTASGAVKMTNATPPGSPTQVAAVGDSKNTSTESSAHNICDLSAQLRTRLSYAMVKVQHGWESQSLDEVEAIASQQASPISLKGTMDHHPARQSPLATASWTSMSRQSSGLSEHSPRSPFSDANQRTVHRQGFADLIELGMRQSGAARSSVNVSRSHGGGPLESPSSNPRSRTYESFWRDHNSDSHTAASKRPQGGQQGSTPTTPAVTGGRLSARQRPSTLAPAVNIIPTGTRNRHHSPRNHESERGGNLQQRESLLSPLNAASRTSNVTSPTNSALPTIQATPPARPRPLFDENKRPTFLRTPSQTEKAAMEQDAVETLLYMSSPGGSRIHQGPNNTPSSSCIQFNLPQTPIQRRSLSPPSTRATSLRTPITPIRTEKRRGIVGRKDDNNQNRERARNVLGNHHSYRNRSAIDLLRRRDDGDEEDENNCGDGGEDDDDIDRMLDAMSSSSSSEDE